MNLLRSKMKELVLILLMTLMATSIAAAVLTGAERSEEYYKQGYLYYQEKNYSAAAAEYDKAIALDPKLAKAYYWKAKCLYALRQYRSAFKSVTKALKLSPNMAEGKSLLRKIEGTSKKTAVAPSEKRSANVPRTSNQTPVPKPEREVHISMDLRAVEISHAFRLLAKETGQNITVGSDVQGKITLSLNNVTTFEAFQAILKASNCTYVTEGRVIRIIPTGEPLKIQYLPGGIINRTFAIDYVNPDDVVATLINLVPEGTKVLAPKGSNYVIVEGPPDAVDKAAAIIGNIDTPPEQVMVEAKILELSSNASSALGMNFQYTNPNNPNEVVQTQGLATLPTATGATGLYYTVTNQDMSTLIEAIQSKTGYNLLSSPKVMAINGKEAEIMTGQRLGYTVKTITTTGLVESVEFLDVGTRLVFTPLIKSNGYILMNIHPEISEGSIVNDLPRKNSTETTTQLLVRDGETIVIGGLMKDNTQKVNTGVPLLSEIPIIGVPFRRVELLTEKREIVVLISPHIVKQALIDQNNLSAKDLEKRRNEQHYESPIDLVK